MRFLWITDPWETLDHARDTTLRLAQEASFLGHASDWCDVKDIRMENGRVFLDACRMQVDSRGAVQLSRPRQKDPNTFDSIHYRVDPPVDLAYLHPLQLLTLGVRARSKIVNPPEILALANEKIENSAHFSDCVPPGLVSSSEERLFRFGKKQKIAVLKPLHYAQSKGVELLRFSSSNEVARSRRLLMKATDGFKRPCLLQRYLKEIASGETRLWFVDGRLLASIKKFPKSGDFRVNIDQGSSVIPASLSSRDKQVARKIGAHLRKCGIRLAAVDLIGGFITDFNVTSPGLIVQMEQVLGRNLARPIISALAKTRSQPGHRRKR